MTRSRIMTDRKLCLRCSGCVAVCPQAALTLREHGIECDHDKCVRCSICVKFCPVQALALEAGSSSAKEGD
jgi:ferredoxin